MAHMCNKTDPQSTHKGQRSTGKGIECRLAKLTGDKKKCSQAGSAVVHYAQVCSSELVHLQMKVFTLLLDSNKDVSKAEKQLRCSNRTYFLLLIYFNTIKLLK